MNNTDHTPATNHRALPGEHLCFRLSGEAFAVPIVQVREVLALPKITAVPASPPFINGVFPLRGVIVPLINLAGRLRLAQPAAGREACAIVVRVERQTGELLLALQVDEILDVADFQPAALAAAPDLGTRVPVDLMLGIHRATDDALTFILDLERTLSPAEIEDATRTASG